jgi:3-phosphoshikimate 1-carboxyvinyltransferase
VKSAVLLAGLHASGETTVREPARTRDHTERALVAFGAAVHRSDEHIRILGGQRLHGRDLAVPGDISSATFWAVLAAATPGGWVEVVDVGLNPTRTTILDVLRRAGARVDAATIGERAGEPMGTLRVACDRLESFDVAPTEVPEIIDEIPALAALAAMMPPGRRFTVRGASELRVKESDRIAALARGFRSMGVSVLEYDDGFTVESGGLEGGSVDAAGDHRLAMAFAIAATRARNETSITGASSVGVSYPGFFDQLARLHAR